MTLENIRKEYLELVKTIKDEKDVASLFKAGGTTALTNQISGLDDFELINFLVVK